MCGIACIVSKGKFVVSESPLLEMMRIQKHRGPDEEGLHLNSHCGLGMVRLSIQDIVSPNLSPLVYSSSGTEGASHVLAFNGEVFNFKDLRSELIGLGHQFYSSGDTEVLLHAYLQWGESCLDRINGMFAFVLADYEKDLLFIARDIAGEKPLYYFEDSEMLIFASEMKALLGFVKSLQFNLNDEYQAFEYMTGAETLFKGIYAMPPSCKMVVKGVNGSYAGYKLSEYWSIANNKIDIDPSKCIDYLDEILTDSIRLRMQADASVGLYLSGGIDSSLIAAIARPKIAFSISFDSGPKYDELSYATLVAKEFGLNHVIIKPNKIDFEQNIDQVLYHMDVPVGSFSAFPLFMLAKEAAKHVKVVLSGEGADELFSGYTRYLLPYHDSQLYGVPMLSNYGSLLDYYYGSAIDRFAKLLNRGLVSHEVVKTVIHEHFSKFDDLIHAMGYTDFKLMLVTLLHMEDRASSAFGLENRSPFLDKRIISFAYSMSSKLKISNYVTKYIVKELAKRYLPAEVVFRQNKLGLVAPINLWMNFKGARGEFDRKSYNEMCFERWRRIFFKS